MIDGYVKPFWKDKDGQHTLTWSTSLFENSNSLPSGLGSTAQSVGSLESFMSDLMKYKFGNTIIVKIELKKYLGEANKYETKNFNVFSWWKIHSPRFSTEMAQD